MSIMGSTSDHGANAPGKNSTSKSSKMHRRSRSGCFTCRLRRKKCDEGKPKCKACRNLGLDCEYKRPQWWSNNDLRRKQKDTIKNIIKRTKSNEKSSIGGQASRMTPPGLSHSMPTSEYSDSMGRPPRAGSPDSDDDDSYDGGVDRSFAATPAMYDPYAHHMYPPHFTHGGVYPHGYSYEVDVKTERQMFVNDIPTRRDSSISTFSTFMPPPPSHATLPSYPSNDFVQHDVFESQHDDWNAEEGLDFNFFDFSHGVSDPAHAQAQTALIPVDDLDRELLDHLIEYVLPLVFPMMDVNQHGSQKSDFILPALEKNKAYLHSCLSAAAVHLRASGGQVGEKIDGDILRHKFAFVTEVVNALGSDTNHLEILEATLGMISLQCCTGRAEEPEKDIPWHQHFQAATELVLKLNLPQILEDMPTQGMHPPFNMTLTAWIDILGSTMLGRSPTFANTYRNKHLSATSTGLAELMGCHDNVMYLLSEVACLDALGSDGRLDDIGICSHITSLAGQLDATESPDEIVGSPFSQSGAIKPRQLSKNITAIFRKSVRVYLCALVPAYNIYQDATINLIASVTEMLQYIPAGPSGYDRCLVWPLLICGAYSIPTSSFRRVFAERIEMMGQAAHQGSFARMVRVLHETWKRNDGIAFSANACEITPVTTHSPGSISSTPTNPTTHMRVVDGTINTGSHVVPVQQITPNYFVHWRDVMRENGWDYLLI